MNRDQFDIKINGKSSQNQIASYLVKVVLGLRDKENEQGLVRLLGSGTAIPHVILVSEIIRSRIQGVSSIVEFESLEKDGKNPEDEFRKYNVPAIRIKLTINPTQEDENQAGYQKPYDVGEDKHVELFDYVMMYAENLYFWAGGRNRERRNKTENRDYNFNNRRERQNTTDHERQNVNPFKSDDWRKDRQEFQNQQKNFEKRTDYQQQQQSQNEQDSQQPLQSRGSPRNQNRRPDRDNQEKREERQHYGRRPTDTQRNDYVKRPQPQRELERQDEKIIQRGNLRTRGGQARNN